jgi:hypothetical protein
MIRILLTAFLTFTAAQADDSDATYNQFDPCSNTTLNPGGESVVKCSYRQELTTYLSSQTLTDEESAALVVSLSSTDYDTAVGNIESNFISS